MPSVRGGKGSVMKRVMAVLTVTGTILLGLVAPAGPTQAKVPGPDGQLLFLRFDPAVGDTVLYTVNPDGSHSHQVLPLVVECAHWSPDGSRIATCGSPSGGATLIINPDTGSYLDVPMPDPDLLTFCWIWSSNGERLACESFGQTDPSLNGIYTIRTSDGQGLTRVTSIAGGDDLPINYSPNGKQIVFDRTDPNGPPGRNQALFVVNVNGSGLHRITPWGFSDDEGSWSPDATKIVFEHFGSLYTVHPDGTHLVKLPLQTGSATTAFTAFDPGWSPDGTKLVFSINTKTSHGATQEGIATANAD